MRDNNKIPDACLQCYVHHRQRLVAHLTRLGGCRALAEDLAQDAWLKLAQVMPEQSLANPKAYLFRIATNLLRDALRHRALVGAGDEAPLELIEAVQADPAGWWNTSVRCDASCASSTTCRHAVARCSNWRGWKGSARRRSPSAWAFR